MINSRKVRAWATPLTVGAFALSAITGVMIFFHLDTGLMKVAHEWFSWFLVLGGLFHVIGSWQSFVQYFSRPVGKAIMAVFALVIVASFIPSGGQGKGMPPAKMSKVLLKTPFATAAYVAQHQPEELMKELASSGIRIESKEETVEQIALRNNKKSVDILNLIF